MARTLDPVSLQLFVAVCEEGSLARAAQREALVPSALSKRIAALEADVGVALLLRQRRGVLPTPAGEALLGRAREVLLAMEAARTELGDFGAGAQGSVRVLASPSALAEALPDDLAHFMARHPRLRISVEEAVSPAIVRSLRDGTADLGVYWDAIDSAELQLARYRSDHLCAAMAPGHALARRPSLRLADTLAHEAVVVAVGGQMDRLLRRQVALLGAVQSPRLQVSSMEAACRMVAAGLGLAILPREVVVPHAGAGRLALVPLAEPWAERRFVVATRRDPLRATSAALLAAHLQRCAEEVAG